METRTCEMKTGSHPVLLDSYPSTARMHEDPSSAVSRAETKECRINAVDG